MTLRRIINTPLRTDHVTASVVAFLEKHGAEYLADDREEPVVLVFAQAVTYAYDDHPFLAGLRAHLRATLADKYRVTGVEFLGVVHGRSAGVAVTIAPTVGLEALLY
jgi:hypothetical protein